jgi:hypothetical protein
MNQQELTQLIGAVFAKMPSLEAMGKAALQPGMKFMVDIVNAVWHQHQASLAEATGHNPRGRPRKVLEAAPALKMHPRDKRHPGHLAWIEKMRQLNVERWAKMPTRSRRQLTAAQKAGKKKSRTPSGGMSWQKMSPAERSAEMIRRRAVALGKAPSKNLRSYQRNKIAARQAAKPNGQVAA